MIYLHLVIIPLGGNVQYVVMNGRCLYRVNHSQAIGVQCVTKTKTYKDQISLDFSDYFDKKNIGEL